MFSVSNEKSPGPDGPSSGFFRKYWNVVGELVTRAVQEFFSNEKLLSQVNASNLVLILKVKWMGPREGVN